LINLADRTLALGPLKALFARADLAITDDTGPRHITMALRHKVITLFGPNDPAWNESGWTDEIQIKDKAPRVPCARPQCKAAGHLCMEPIPVEDVCQAAEKLLG